MNKMWNWVRSRLPEKRGRLRASLGVRRATEKSARASPDVMSEATENTTVWFSFEKARALLGYAPRVHFADEMRLVEQWLRYAADL
jgi:hypothetical protein